MPNFLNIESENFNPEKYVAPPFNSASTSLCWRYDPNKGKELQSNSRIIRWSDGSLTLQLASNPQEQYRISTKRLAEPSKTKKSGQGTKEPDSHVYLGAAAEAASVIRITSHLTSALTVLPTTFESDDAVLRLKESLAAASKGSRKNADGTVAMFDVKEDPELAKRQAELAEREKLREARKRQMATEKEADRGRRVGLSSRTGGGGLTVAGLEGDEMMTTKARGPKKPRQKSNRRGEIYSDDEDEYDRRGRTREDEYDEDDGFLVGSDEEPEVEDDEEEEEQDFGDEDEDAEGEFDEDTRPQKPAPREKAASPKRSAEPASENVGRSPVETGTAGSPPTRKKHRYVVDDEDDE